MESLSATFIAKCHVSVLSTGRNTTGKDSSFHEILLPHQDTPKLISQYQMSALSLRYGVVKNSLIIDLPVIQSTPLLHLCDEKTASCFNSEASCLQLENNVKRQLFNDTSRELLQSSQSSKLSSPCHCLDTEVVNQLTSLQQDLDSSVNKLESSLSQGSGSLLSPDLMSEVVLSHSDSIISPPMQFSERYNCTIVPTASAERTVSTISTQESTSNVGSQHFNSVITLDHSYALFNKLMSIVKLMQLYPVSVAFIAWYRYVQKRKSLSISRAKIHYTINHNIMRNTFTVWKLHTCKVLQYKELEISLLINFQKRILSSALQKWIAVYHKRLKNNNVLDNLLVSRNQHVLKNSFFKWRNNFEINIRIRNHMVIIIINVITCV